MLRTVNSSYYGLSTRCSTIKQAIAFLGLNTVKALVLGFSLAESVDGSEDVTFDYVDYWRRDLHSAAAARALADRVRACDPEEAFVAALMQDIGMVAIYRVLEDEYLQVMDMAHEDHRDLAKVEQRVLQIDHVQVGAAIASAWRLPAQLVEGIRCHHNASAAPDEARSISRVVELANHATAAVTLSDGAAALSRFRQLAKEWFELEASDADEIMEAFTQATHELSKIFSLPIGGRVDMADILLRAESVRDDVRDEIGNDYDRVQQISERLASETIGSSGEVVAADQFARSMTGALQDAHSDSTSVSLIVMAPDRVDTHVTAHGPDVVAEVLELLGRRIQQRIGAVGTVFDFMSQQFAVIVPDLDPAAVQQLGESVREHVEGNPILHNDEREVAITFSIGIATTTGPDTSDPRAFVRAAALLARKAATAGGNRVECADGEHASSAVGRT